MRFTTETSTEGVMIAIPTTPKKHLPSTLFLADSGGFYVSGKTNMNNIRKAELLTASIDGEKTVLCIITEHLNTSSPFDVHMGPNKETRVYVSMQAYMEDWDFMAEIQPALPPAKSLAQL